MRSLVIRSSKTMLHLWRAHPQIIPQSLLYADPEDGPSVQYPWSVLSPHRKVQRIPQSIPVECLQSIPQSTAEFGVPTSPGGPGTVQGPRLWTSDLISARLVEASTSRGGWRSSSRSWAAQLARRKKAAGVCTCGVLMRAPNPAS